MVEREAPNPMLFAIVVAGAVLEVTGNLTTWWGIAIVAAIVLLAMLAEMTTDLISTMTKIADIAVIIPAGTAGLFVGDAIFDTWWGVAVGFVVAALFAAIPAALLTTVLERYY